MTAPEHDLQSFPQPQSESDQPTHSGPVPSAAQILSSPEESPWLCRTGSLPSEHGRLYSGHGGSIPSNSHISSILGTASGRPHLGHTTALMPSVTLICCSVCTTPALVLPFSPWTHAENQCMHQHWLEHRHHCDECCVSHRCWHNVCVHLLPIASCFLSILCILLLL